jgi:hypothetical protein
MNEILCFDANGNSIDKLSQWDTNMELFINWEYSVTPIFHFCNTNSKRILVVKGTVDSEDGTISKANIPNILLQEASPIVVYVYMEKDTPTGYLTGETIYSFQIPVREKPKPVDYKYFENTEYTSIDAMSIWNMAHITEGDVEVLFGNPKSELQLVSEWVNSKINHAIGSKNIYSLYCPVCKAQAIEEVSSTHHCDECGSIYTFYTDNNSRENIWFIKLGRR